MKQGYSRTARHERALIAAQKVTVKSYTIQIESKIKITSYELQISSINTAKSQRP